MADERTKQQLINRRTTLIASLGRTEHFVEKYTPERDRGQVQLRLDNLDTVWMGLEDVQTQLEDLETTNEGMAQNLHYRSHNETRYFAIKAALQSYLPIVPHSTNAIPQSASSGLPGIKLPTITLPEFDGDYNQWLAFHDTFDALIHSNPEVHDIQKFHYLRAALKGEAAQLVESIGISSANYTIAWQTLVSRYANDYLLKKRHLQALLDCPCMKKESASALHSLVDEYERHTKTLRQLGEPIDSWSTMLEHLLCLRLDDVTLKAWEDFATTAENPDYRCLIEFLQRRLRVLESMSVNHKAQPAPNPQPPMFHRPSFHKTVSHAAVEATPPKCYSCDQHHPLFQCSQFETMSLPDRQKLVNDHRLCHNCFRQGHIARNCLSKFSCRYCKKRHHSLLHPDYHPTDADQPPTTSHISAYSSKPFERQGTAVNQRTSTSTDAVTAQSSNSSQLSNANVFLSTVVLLVYDCDGKLHPVRALLDNGSQSNIISDRLCQMLRLQRNKTNIPVYGVGESSSSVKHSVRTTIGSRKCNYEISLDFLVMPRITIDLPVVSTSDWKAPQNLFLADPTFNKTGAIDMLLGAEHFFTFVNSGTRIEKAESPVLIDSIFGWIVTGRIQTPLKPYPETCHVVLADPLRSPHERIAEKENQPNYSVEEQQCDFHQASTVSRTPEGRYMKGLNTLRIGTQPIVQFCHEELIKPLGAAWEPVANSTPIPTRGLPTKQSTLSPIPKHSNPLDFNVPVVIRARMMLQTSRRCEAVSDSSRTKWDIYSVELSNSSTFPINRFAFLPNSTVQLYTCEDASQQLYGAYIYARSTNPEGQIHVQLIASKSKVAPLKRLSIPRLELSAAVLAVRLHQKVVLALDMPISASHFWSDSTVTFVANRVSESRCHHIAGKQNPADLVSRGIKVDDFLGSELWHHGPAWLKLPESNWPMAVQQQKTPEDILERREMVAAIQNKPSENPIFCTSSSYNRVIRVTAYCFRFIRACRRQTSNDPAEDTATITVDEMEMVHKILVKLVQADVFEEEIRHLEKGEAVLRHSHLRLLCPFVNPEDIKGGSRLRISKQPYLSKHPILLSSSHPFTRSVAHQYPLKLLHGGGRVTLAVIRQEYWLLQKRRLVMSNLYITRYHQAENRIFAQDRIKPSDLFSITRSRNHRHQPRTRWTHPSRRSANPQGNHSSSY